jgi:hypothetical protein
VAGQRSAKVGGDSGTGVDMLSRGELPTPPAPSKWTYSMLKLSDVRVESSSTALSHIHPHRSSIRYLGCLVAYTEGRPADPRIKRAGTETSFLSSTRRAVVGTFD